MAKQHIIFVEGCIKHGGMKKDEAEKIWTLFEPFQGYGFNKAHAASYGKVAYQTSYMKANYPVEYLAALLTADSGDTEQISIFVGEAKRMGVKVLPPDVNESGSDFTVVGKTKRFCTFRLVIHQELRRGHFRSYYFRTKTSGPFKTLSEFLSRVGSKKSEPQVA